MNNPVDFKKEYLKNFLINRSFLTNKAETIESLLQTYKCIQVDPISVVAKSHEIAIWNRVENFKKVDLENALYSKNRTLFEYWLQLYSIIPMQFFPYFFLRMRTKNDWQDDFYKKHQKEVQFALDYIKEHGPTSGKDLAHIPKVSALFSWKGGQNQKALLEYLWDTGQIMISHRANNNKYYDLTERILPIDIQNIKVTEKEALDFILQSQFDYLGVIRKSMLNRMGYVSDKVLKQFFEQQVEKGHIRPILIAGKRINYFVREQDVDTILQSKEIMHDKVNILSPLDPLVIDRKLLSLLFEFDYIWEAYTPPTKRKFGYYGMPIPYNGNIVGQIELLKDNNILKIKNIAVTEKSKDFTHKLQNEIDELSRFVFD